MTHQSPPLSAPSVGDAAEQDARLREVLALVEEIAGEAPTARQAYDEGARLSCAYEAASPLDRRRFDTHAAETARWAAAGVEALLANHARGRSPRAAAARLADELRAALSRLSTILRA